MMKGFDMEIENVSATKLHCKSKQNKTTNLGKARGPGGTEHGTRITGITPGINTAFLLLLSHDVEMSSILFTRSKAIKAIMTSSANSMTKLIVQSRTVTDIESYREKDQSHLHLWEAQSTMRKFELKLREREKRRKGKEEEVKEREKVEPIDLDTLPDYIERQPSELLRLLGSNIGRDFTAPDYRYHDDPYLIPYNSIQKRDYMLAKEGGRKAARYIFDKHPELFEKNLIEMHPQIKAFMPKMKFDEEKANEELLEVYLQGFNLKDAVDVYKALEKKGVAIKEETTMRLLQMLAFHNEEEPLGEDHNLTAGMPKVEVNPWVNGGLAEKIYSKMDPITPEARATILCGMARHRQFQRGLKMYEECKANSVVLDTNGFNAALSCCIAVGDNLGEVWSKTKEVLTEMRDAGCRPDVETVCSVLATLRHFSSREYEECCALSLSVLSEFKKCGVEFSLAVFKLLLEVHDRKLPNRSTIIMDIMKEVEGRDWSDIQHEDDCRFFQEAMMAARKLGNAKLAYQIHDLVHFGNNYSLLSNYGESYNYYKHLLYVILHSEPIDTFMDFYNQLVPHVHSPTNDFNKVLLRCIKRQGAFHHLPKFWTDLQVTRFSGVKKDYRLEMMREFLDLIVTVDLDNPNFNVSQIGDAGALKRSFNQMAKEALDEVKSDPDSRFFKLSQNISAAPICNHVITMSLRDGNLSLASEAVDFCKSNIHIIPGALDLPTVDSFIRASISAGEKKGAINGLAYTIEAHSESPTDLGLQIARTFELSESEKKLLNQLFSHETKWQKLTVST